MSLIHVGKITFDWYPADPLVRRLAEAAVDGGCIVDVICLRQPHEPKHEVYNGVSIYRLPMNRGFGRPLPETLLHWCWFLLLAAVKVTMLHLKRRYHVIHVHNMPDFLVFAALIPKLLGTKVILHVQDITPELMAVKAKGRVRGGIVRLATWQERISTAFVDHIITVGWPFEKLLLQRGVPQEKITIILNSADPKYFPCPLAHHSPPPSTFNDDRPFLLIYHGTVAERSGLDIAVRALALVLRVVPHVRLEIKGRGEYMPSLKRLVQELNMTDNVVFTNLVTIDQVADFIAHGDAGIIPYRSNGFMDLLLPTKAYEFAWMHCPMIASDTPAIRSMFRPESIALCDSSNPESLANAIIDLYQHPEKRVCMAASAAEDYLPYRWERMAERYQQLLRSLYGGRQQGKVSPPVASGNA